MSEERIKKLEEALNFAETNWKQSAQANFKMSQELNQIKDKYESLIQEKDALIKEKEEHIKVWKTAYETVIASKTWKFAKKMKRLIGKGKED